MLPTDTLQTIHCVGEFHITLALIFSFKPFSLPFAPLSLYSFYFTYDSITHGRIHTYEFICLINGL